jgi:hypothetical protein
MISGSLQGMGSGMAPFNMQPGMGAYMLQQQQQSMQMQQQSMQMQQQTMRMPQQSMQMPQQSMQMQGLGSTGSMPWSGLSALLAEEESAAAAAAAAKQVLAMQQQEQQQPVVPAGTACMQQQAMQAQGMQQQQQQTMQQQQAQLPTQPAQQSVLEMYDTSAIADCPELLQKLKDLPAPAVQQVRASVNLRWHGCMQQCVCMDLRRTGCHQCKQLYSWTSIT